MSLLDEAAADVRSILTDVGGFSVPIVVTSPEGVSASLRGLQTDVSLVVDPETGVGVGSRRASVAVSILDLQSAGFGTPEAIPEEEEKPWLVSWTPPTGGVQTMKVTASIPDKLGIVVLQLERYRQ